MPLHYLAAPSSTCPPACCDLESRQVASDLDCSQMLIILVLDQQLPSELVCAGIPDICLKKVLDHVLQDGQGPLHVAADLGNTKVVRTLMQLGADKDSRDKVWQSPCSPRSLTLLLQAMW